MLLKILMTPNRMIHHSTPRISPSISRVASCLNFHHADSKWSSHDEEETRQTRCSCCCHIPRGPSCFSTRSLATKVLQIFLFVLAAALLHKWYLNEIATKERNFRTSARKFWLNGSRQRARIKLAMYHVKWQRIFNLQYSSAANPKRFSFIT